MRHATRILCLSALVLATTRAGAQVPDSTPTLSDELLRLWNRTDTVTSDAMLDETNLNESGFELDGSGASPLSGYQRPGGGALTPNLDRLLGNGMDAAPDPSAPVAKDSPYGFAPNNYGASKGSTDPTISTGRSRCRERGHRHDRSCRPEPPRCGERGHRHSRHCRPPRLPGHTPPPNTPPTPTPEPASMLLLGLGAGAAAGARAIRNRRKN